MRGSIVMEIKETPGGVGLKCKCEVSNVSLMDKAILVNQLYEMLDVDDMERTIIQGMLDNHIIKGSKKVHEELHGDFDLDEKLRELMALKVRSDAVGEDLDDEGEPEVSFELSKQVAGQLLKILLGGK